jgi:transcriptional regulator with XRE-family HTH domain
MEFVLEIFGARLQEARQAKGLTQPELAALVGSSTKHVSKMENGLVAPTWPLVVKLCEALEIDCRAFSRGPRPKSRPGRGRPRKPESD